MRNSTFIAGVTCLTVMGVAVAIHTQRPPSIQPFTAQRVDLMIVRSDNIKQLGSTRTIAVRSDGSISQNITDSATGVPAKVQIIDDASSGEHVITDERTRTRTTWYYSKEGMDKRIAHATTTCKGSPAGQILGFDAYLDESDRQVGPIYSHIKSWAAPKLNCYPLRYEILNKTGSGGGKYAETRSVTSVTLGEPSAALFGIDPAYVEVPPSGLDQELSRLFPQFFSAPDPNVNRDGAYWASRKNRLK